QRFRHLFHLESRAGVHDSWILQAEQWRDDGARAYGDDAMFEAARGPVLQVQSVGVVKARSAPDIFDLSALAKQRQVFAERFNDLESLTPQHGKVGFRWAVLDTPGRDLADVGDEPCHVQQSLGRNTTDVKASPARFLQAVD